MNTNVSFRHMEVSPALRDYAQSKLERIVDKYVRGKVDASIVMSVEKFRHIANFTLQIKNLTVKGEESSQDMYSSIDMALDKIERQLRRHKDRLRDHKPSQGEALPFTMSVIPAPEPDEYEADEADELALADEPAPVDDEPEAQDEPDEEIFEAADGQAIHVVRRRDYAATRMHISEAVVQLDLLGDDRRFFVFTNDGTGAINIIYRRADGNFGLIET